MFGIGHIIRYLKYRQLADNFKKNKKVKKGLITFPDGYEPSGFNYREYIIFMKSESTYLLFYIVDKSSRAVYILRVLQDGTNWKYILSRRLREN